MTASNREARLDEDVFDRLVDGELTEEERSALLTRLDDEPALWRRCALAFLEAQTWREAIGDVFTDLAGSPASPAEDRSPSRAEPVSDIPSPTVVPGAAPVARPSRAFGETRIAKLTAMAAGFALAFLIGVWGHTWWLNRQTAATTDFARQAPAQSNDERNTSTAPTIPQVASVPAYSPYQWEWVTVPVSDESSNKVETLSLPVIPRESPSEDVWCGILPTPLPPEIADILLRQGHEIRQHRELVPVSLPDGSQAVMPIDEYEVRFIRHKRFQ